MSTHVDVFIDYVCPFCFLIEGALEELRSDRDVEVKLHPFELRPDPVPTLRPEDEYLPRVWEASVYPMAHRVGMEVKLPTLSPQPRTEKAFMVLQLAQEQGKAESYSAAMFRAFFQDDRNIAEDNVLIDVARSAGLEPRAVAVALNSQERQDRQRSDQDYAVNTAGIHSVPAIVIDGQLLRGVSDAARLKNAVDRLAGQQVSRSEAP